MPINVDVLSADIKGKYLNVTCKYNINFRAGVGIGFRKGLEIVNDRSLYGLNSADAVYMVKISHTLLDLGFESCLDDTDVWMWNYMNPYDFKFW